MRAGVLAQDDDRGCSLRVEVVPGSRTSEISAVNRWRMAVRVKIAAPPRDCEANEELVRFLAERLAIRPRDVEIISGTKATIKVVHLPLSASEAMSRMGV
jgi:uncharacterized protein (TIGR00251 family)